MKIFTKKTAWPLYGLGLLMLVYACTNKTAEPLSPFSTEALTKVLKDLKLPNLRQTAAAQVTTTAGAVTPSATANAVYSGIASIPSQNSVPAVVSQAVTDMNAALAAAGVTATDFNANFTPSVINGLEAGGILPGGLQSTVNTLTGNANLQSYLATSTLPTVNGQPVGPTTTSVTGPTPVAQLVKAITIAPINYPASGDPCFKAANDLFDQKIANLSTDLAAELTLINNQYTQDKAAAENGRTVCISGKLSTYTNMLLTDKQTLATNLANLNAAQSILGTSSFNTLKALIYVLYSHKVQLNYRIQTAEVNTCSISADVRIAEVVVARDTDANSANSGFNSTITTAQKLVLQLYDSCHNQGSAQ